VRNGLPGSTLPDFGCGTGIALECAEGIPGSLLHPRWFFTGQDGQERRSRAQRRKASSPMWCRFFLRPSAVGLPAPSDFMRLVTCGEPRVAIRSKIARLGDTLANGAGGRSGQGIACKACARRLSTANRKRYARRATRLGTAPGRRDAEHEYWRTFQNRVLRFGPPSQKRRPVAGPRYVPAAQVTARFHSIRKEAGPAPVWRARSRSER